MGVLKLSAIDQKNFTKLYASADDVSVARQWAQHLQKKKWYRRPWSWGKIYLHQSAYVTAIVVAYGRVFSVGRGGFNFPKRLVPYDAVEWDLHHRLLDMRDKVHAHSDLEKWRVEPWHVSGFSTTIVGQPQNVIEETDIELFLNMTEKLLARIADRREQILRAYKPISERGPEEDPIDKLIEAVGRLEVGEKLNIPVGK